MLSRFKPLLAGCSFAGLLLGSAGALAAPEDTESTDTWSTESTESTDTRSATSQRGETMAAEGSQQEQELRGPAEDVQEAAKVLAQLREQAPDLAGKVTDAKGVFIIPDYATAALLVGGSGGEGVLMTQQDGQWGNPGFYDIGNIDIGAQVGAAAGSIVMLLMSDEAVQNFQSGETDFSLTAEAGLTIVNWSAHAPATTEEGDVLVWSDTEGLLAEASVGVGGISWDEEEAREYYNQDVQAEQVLAGDVTNPNEDVLQSEFAAFTSGSSSSEPMMKEDKTMMKEDKTMMKEDSTEQHP